MHEHLKRFLQFLSLNRNASAHTVRAYESDLSQWLVHVAAASGIKRGAVSPAHLDRAALRSFLGDLHKRGQSRASAARKLAAARTFLRYLRREGLIEDDPGAMVATPKRDVRMPAHLSESEMSALIDAASEETSLGRRDRAILELFYASGLRLSELVGLDLEDVNLSARMSRVLGKGGKQRLVPFNTSTAKAIRAYLNAGMTCCVRICKVRFSCSIGSSPPGFSSAAIPFRLSSSRSCESRSTRLGPVPNATLVLRISG